jgi:hypothetical protein
MPHAETGRAVKLAGMTALVLILCTPAPALAIYKWVDEKGVTHFSETPPPDGRKATKVQPKVTPPSGEAAPSNWKQREQDARKLRIEREQANEAARAKAHNEAAERANRCAKAKRELQVLNTQVPVYSINDKGERVYLEDRERAEEIALWTKEARDHCDSR